MDDVCSRKENRAHWNFLPHLELDSSECPLNFAIFLPLQPVDVHYNQFPRCELSTYRLVATLKFRVAGLVQLLLVLQTVCLIQVSKFCMVGFVIWNSYLVGITCWVLMSTFRVTE